jgi:hypothetical protein
MAMVAFVFAVLSNREILLRDAARGVDAAGGGWRGACYSVCPVHIFKKYFKISMTDIDIVRVADVLAIPGFALLAIYFASKRVKTPFEWSLLAFSVAGLVVDSVFTLLYFGFANQKQR